MTQRFKGYVTIIVLLGMFLSISVPAFAQEDTNSMQNFVDYPSSCQEISSNNPAAADGNYTILSEPHLVTVYCSNMQSDPKEYLNLVQTGGNYNYSTILADSIHYRGTTVVTHYQMVRFNPTDARIIQSDQSFSTSTGGLYNGTTSVDYGTGGSCNWGNGRASVDLTGTFLTFAPDQFQWGGWIAYGDVTYSSGNQVVNLGGGGNCGSAGPINDSIQLEWQYQALQMTAPQTSHTGEAAISAKLIDASGQPVANRTIFFHSSEGSITSSSVTDSNGIASAVLHTSVDANVNIQAQADIGGSYGETSVLFDKTSPVTTTNVPEGWVNHNVTLSFSAEDHLSGVTNTYYSVDGGAVETGTSVIISSAGEHSVTYYSVDNAGNEESHHTASVKIDTTSPATTPSITGSKGYNGWYTTDVQVQLSATDSLSGVNKIEYSLDNGDTWENYAGAVTISNEGQNTVLYRSIDNAGNTEEPQQFTVKMDKAAPTLQLALNLDSIWSPNHKMFDIQVTYTDEGATSGIDQIKLISITSNQDDNSHGDGNTSNDIQGAEYNSADTSFQLRAERTGNEERIYTITYLVTDQAGNQTTQSATVTVPQNQSKHKNK